MRAFIAIEIPQNIKQKLIEIEDKFKEIGFDCKFVPEDNFHITLQFLGEISEMEGKILMDILESKLPKSPFPISIEKIGLFKTGKVPRILFFDISQGEKELTSLNQTVVNYSKNIIYKNKLESNFKAHITFGRVGDIKFSEIGLIERLIHELEVNLTFDADEIILFESVSENTNSLYKIKRAIKLQ